MLLVEKRIHCEMRPFKAAKAIRGKCPLVPPEAARFTGLLQNRDLPRVIKLMLRDAMEHVIKVVTLSRNAVAQSFIG